MSKGFRVIVGKKDSGGGMFEYFEGTEEKAKEYGNKMKDLCVNSFYQLEEEVTITLQAVDLKKCNSSFCKNICESDEQYCLRCEDLMNEARWDYENEEEHD